MVRTRSWGICNCCFFSSWVSIERETNKEKGRRSLLLPPSFVIIFPTEKSKSQLDGVFVCMFCLCTRNNRGLTLSILFLVSCRSSLPGGVAEECKDKDRVPSPCDFSKLSRLDNGGSPESFFYSLLLPLLSFSFFSFFFYFINKTHSLFFSHPPFLLFSPPSVQPTCPTTKDTTKDTSNKATANSSSPTASNKDTVNSSSPTDISRAIASSRAISSSRGTVNRASKTRTSNSTSSTSSSSSTQVTFSEGVGEEL